MTSRSEQNIYDLVEEAAARRGIPRLKLWQEVTQALVERTLKTQNGLSVSPHPAVPGISFLSWLEGFRSAVNNHNDPNSVARILKAILVRRLDFERWLKNAHDRRGPRPGTTGYQEADRKLFDCISRLLREGTAKSTYNAALLLAEQGKIQGGGTPDNKAKRVSGRYLKERGSH
jgi:hypothetical protein